METLFAAAKRDKNSHPQDFIDETEKAVAYRSSPWKSERTLRYEFQQNFSPEAVRYYECKKRNQILEKRYQRYQQCMNNEYPLGNSLPSSNRQHQNDSPADWEVSRRAAPEVFPIPQFDSNHGAVLRQKDGILVPQQKEEITNIWNTHSRYHPQKFSAIDQPLSLNSLDESHIVSILPSVNINAEDQDGWSLLRLCARRGNVRMIELLMKDSRLEVNGSDRSTGMTALHCACIGRHTHIVERLLRRQANPNVVDTSGRSPLNLACFTGCIGIVSLLLSAKAKIDLADVNGWTPLICACSEGHFDIVRLLLAKNPSLNLRTVDSTSAVGMAALRGHHKIVKQLLLLNPKISSEYIPPSAGLFIVQVCEEIQKDKRNADIYSGLNQHPYYMQQVNSLFR